MDILKFGALLGSMNSSFTAAKEMGSVKGSPDLRFGFKQDKVSTKETALERAEFTLQLLMFVNAEK